VARQRPNCFGRVRDENAGALSRDLPAGRQAHAGERDREAVASPRRRKPTRGEAESNSLGAHKKYIVHRPISMDTKHIYNRIAREFSSSRAFLWDDLKTLGTFVADGGRVLDVGCGNGRLLQLFQGRAISYTGLDQSAELIAIAREKYPHHTYVIGDMRSLPFPDASFDAVYCIAAFHHLPEDVSRRTALEEMKRVLAPGGTMILINWNLRSAWAEKKYGTGDGGDFHIPWKNTEGTPAGDRYYHAFTPDELHRLAADAGLAVHDQWYARRCVRSDETNGENIITILKK
jgi:ubiquinone/menaquinone biosynthesis C-methylase UbiE